MGAGRRNGRSREAAGDEDPAPSVENRSPEALDLFQLFLDDIRDERLLTAAEESALARKVEQGDRRAYELMVRSNLRLVVSVARRYQGHGVPLTDLVQEGAIGLHHAVERFDWRRGCRFSTYATWWITQHVKRGLGAGARTIRLPVRVADLQRRVRVAESALRDELGRPPTEAEIASRIDASERQVHEAVFAASAAGLPDDGSGEAGGLETLPDRSPGPEEVVEERLALDAVHRALAQLPAPEREVIRLRFGLGGGRPCAPELVGRLLGLDARKVRRLERVALVRLRTSAELP